VLAVLAVLE